MAFWASSHLLPKTTSGNASSQANCPLYWGQAVTVYLDQAPWSAAATHWTRSAPCVTVHFATCSIFLPAVQQPWQIENNYTWHHHILLAALLPFLHRLNPAANIYVCMQTWPATRHVKPLLQPSLLPSLEIPQVRISLSSMANMPPIRTHHVLEQPVQQTKTRAQKQGKVK